jgi:hypothetical protein
MNRPVNNHVPNELTPQQIAKIVQLLDEATKSIDSTTLAHLAESRQQAVAVLGNRTQVAPAQPLSADWKSRFGLSRHGDYRFWVPALLLLVVLVGALSSNLTRNNMPIDTDSLVLASELPPEAFADKEFVAWLEHTSRL